MFAVVEIAGQQFKVAKADKIFVPLLTGKSAQRSNSTKFCWSVTISRRSSALRMSPALQSRQRCLSHVKDDKVEVFKKKKRKGYKVFRGHRQQYTELEITKVA